MAEPSGPIDAPLPSPCRVPSTHTPAATSPPLGSSAPHLEESGGIPADVLLQGSLPAAHQPLQECQGVLMAQAAAAPLASGALPQLQALQPDGLLLPAGGKLGSKGFQAPLQGVHLGQDALLCLAGQGQGQR